ncbi:MAG: single-stranded-DNA-specific exonuclease RecJ [Phormidium sp.]
MERSHPPAFWHCSTPNSPPDEFVRAVQRYAPTGGRRLATLLWNRNQRDLSDLRGFLDADYYQPTPATAFGAELQQAIARLQQAIAHQEPLAIWGDFDADGVTATSVLWEGLGQFFDRGPDSPQLSYYIPNRLTESHGLNRPGIERLAAAGIRLIVTCDTGSTNLDEIQYAAELGVDIIVTDHHTLLPQRPPVTALINPRNFPADHPLYHLSGVAVAYKLVEALYAAQPEIPQQPLESLLDLVAIGLIADLVELRGDCRYLAQRGLVQLRRQLETPTHPGVKELLRACKRHGDRPTDISFGIGPRINAVSRIYGDASFCVELLTSRDGDRSRQLAQQANDANDRRKEVQQRVLQSVQRQLQQTDLSTTSVIVLSDPQWDVGVLGLVAGQIASDWGRPTLLFCEDPLGDPPLARGSARSVAGLDLYELVNSQSHLLHRFGGHPFAAGLSLPLENLPLLREALNQQLLQRLGRVGGIQPSLNYDLEVTVADLGQDLFAELKCLEPCGMGNPVPRLLLRQCQFEGAYHQKLQVKGHKLQYLITHFQLQDASCDRGFPGTWWGHYQDELPANPCDVIVELDVNTNSKTSYKIPKYQVRLIDVRPSGESTASEIVLPDFSQPCGDPISTETLAETAQQTWLTLIGIAKYLSRTGEPRPRRVIQEKLGIGDRPLEIGLNRLGHLGFSVHYPSPEDIAITAISGDWGDRHLESLAQPFLDAVCEEQFRQRHRQPQQIT